VTFTVKCACGMQAPHGHTLCSLCSGRVRFVGNPWAGISPDCPRGHHARRVFLWSYDETDPLPWYCADCRRRFKAPAAAGGDGSARPEPEGASGPGDCYRCEDGWIDIEDPMLGGLVQARCPDCEAL